MFFRKRIDGIDFGEYLARQYGSRVPEILLSMERRFALHKGEGQIERLNAATYNPKRGSFKYEKFVTCWLLSLSHLIPLATKDGRYCIKHGMLNIVNGYARDHEINGSYVMETTWSIDTIVNDDEILASSGHLQDYDNNNHREINDKVGVSYSLASYILKNTCMARRGREVAEALIVGLVLELETDFRLGLHLYRKCKIV